ncbi:MAG: hypothetical protein IME93_02320 [Proteobacteria bacterium]|nr:hypothetical protein [Pseudomonadota bacterium]
MKKNQHKNTSRSTAQSNRIQAEIAAEAGRIMAEEGVQDFRQAKLKARDRLRLGKDVPLPSNQAIQLAHDEHLTLFTPQEQILARRYKIMKAAAEAMEFLQQFKPRLVADFLEHPVTRDTTIELHLETSGPEVIAHFLQQHQLPFKQTEKQIRFGTNDAPLVPEFNFEADENSFSLTILNTIQSRQSPRAAGMDTGQHRMSLSQVMQWLDGGLAQ